MLVLTRKPGEKVLVGHVTVTVLEMSGSKIRLGFEAPDDVRILRSELAFWQDSPAPAAAQEPKKSEAKRAPLRTARRPVIGH